MSKKTNQVPEQKINKEKTRRLTLAAMLTAIVVVLALLGTAIKFGTFSINLSLVPIVVGAALLGPVYGAWFGFVNAVVILISGDAALFLTFNPVGTVITVLLKGILAGLASGFVYTLLSKKNKYAAVLLAALVCPVVNTGIFVLGCRVFFWDYLPKIAEILQVPLKSKTAFTLLVLVGMNFPIELVTNIILAPAIARILGFSQEKDTALEVYGCVLAVLGSAVLLGALILLRMAYIGKLPPEWGIQRPGLRYAIMALLSNIVQVCGFALLAVGFGRKKAEKSIEKKSRR